MSERRGKLIMTAELMASLLGVPGGTIRGIKYDPDSHLCSVLVSDDRLDEVPEAQESPVIHPWDRTMYPENYKSSKSSK